ncbi:MAG: hypothetical protein RL662_215 [Bacteroidota bacterium]|jgi:hypothetical protein
MKKNIKKISMLAAIIAVSSVGNISAQDKTKAAADTVKTQGSDRNVMLNAASANAGPRNVNIGLPASVGGTTVLENNLPVVYFYWPELPFKAWRIDAMTNGVKLLDLGETAINVGDVGFSVGTYNNLGTDKFQGNGSLNTNHFGLLNGSLNVSGPIGTTGLKYSVGAFLNYDPGTYKVNKNNIDRYFNDQTQLYKAALTKDYKFDSGTGSLSVFYKFIDTKSMTMQQAAPYHYFKDGSVKELDGFKIGGDNYQLGQKITLKDAFTGKLVERDVLDDYGSTSHTLDLIGNNKYDNGLKLNYIVRGHSAETGVYLPLMIGILPKNAPNAIQGQDAQAVLVLASRKTPIKSLTGLLEVGKKSGKHDWKVGMNQWLYNIDKFATEGTTYYQSVEANPKRLTENGEDRFEYHNGSENRTALFALDKWDVTDLFTLNLGARLEYHSLRGDYINNADRGAVNADLGYVTTAKKTDIKKDWFNTALMLSGVYKVTGKFGVLGEVTYNEQGGHLENYSSGNDPNIKKSTIPGAGLGIFYNHPMVSLVSKATYIQRDEYRGTVNFTNPTTNDLKREMVSYDIETLGWTTDAVITPFKNFSLHTLLTIQAPKYKNYKGTVDFGSNTTLDYNYSDKVVNGVSKVLIEIDPSYQWNDLRVWASARYFSKQYANLTNSLAFKGRWETFAGANYSLNKHLDFNLTVVNVLNQRGAQGSISGADLLEEKDVDEFLKNNNVFSGTYIRPFTLEVGMKFRF